VAAVSGVQSIDRVVAVMSAFTPERPLAGISDLARITGMSRSTVHRLVQALSAHGLLQQLPDSSTCSLGPRLLSYAEVARGHLTLNSQAVPLMTWLRDHSGETVGLHVMDGTNARRTVAQVESTQELRRTFTDLGSPLPAHQGAPGKVLLAFADESIRQQVLGSKLVAADGQTPVSAVKLRQELGDIVARGYALSLQERVIGVVSLAVPVYDHTGKVAAAMSISIPAVRAGLEELEALAPAVLEAAKTLSYRLGFGLGAVSAPKPQRGQDTKSRPPASENTLTHKKVSP
jgi:DNA-binding IclR family transcriptional regulator